MHDVHFCLYLAFFAALAAWVIGILLLRKKFLLKNAQGLINPNFIETEPKQNYAFCAAILSWFCTIIGYFFKFIISSIFLPLQQTSAKRTLFAGKDSFLPFSVLNTGGRFQPTSRYYYYRVS